MPSIIPDSIEKYLFDELKITSKMADNIIIWHNLLLKWQPKINLISPKTIENIWERHFYDSLQVHSFLPIENKHLHFADFGSGAGFPGLAIALLCQGKVTLVESDQRKAIFLREVIRLWGENKRILVKNTRIEKLGDISFDIISARALAPLHQLLSWSAPYLTNDGQCLFFKGKSWNDEIKEAKKYWTFDHKTKISQTNEEAMIIMLNDIRENEK